MCRLLDDGEAVGRVARLILEDIRCGANDQRVELAHDCLVLGGVVELGELDSLIVRSASHVFEDESGDSPDGFPVVK